MTPSSPVASLRRLVDNVLRIGDVVSGPIATFDSHESCGRVQAAMKAQRFDVVGVGESPIWHCVELEAFVEADLAAPVSTIARPILAEDCIEPSLSLAEFVEVMGRREFVFVLRGGEIGAIATRAELQAPAMTVSVLAHLISIELGLSILVPRLLGSSWAESLRPARRAAALELLERKQEQNLDSGLEECLYFSDWLELAAVEAVRTSLGYDSARRFRKAAGPFADLRNELAHGGTILNGCTVDAAVDRFGRIRGFLDRTWDAVDHTDDLWDSYLDTDIVAGDCSVSELPEVLRGARLHVITAWNPMSISRSVETNRAANLELRTLLESHDLVVSEALGRARSGSSAEESLYVVGANRKLAARIGGQFGQKAIFEVADGELRLVRCSDAQVIRRRPLGQSPTGEREPEGRGDSASGSLARP